MQSTAEGFPSLAFRHPVLTTEGNKCDKEAVLGEIRAEHDGKAMAASAMADQPSVERWRQSNSGQRVGGDVGDKLIDLIKVPSGSVEAPTGDFDNVINQRSEVLVDQRMSNDAHRAAVPPPDLASLARWARAPDVMDASVRTGSHASRGRARRLWTSASKGSCSAVREVQSHF